MEDSKNHPNHKSMEERLNCQTCKIKKAQIEEDILKVTQGTRTPVQSKAQLFKDPSFSIPKSNLEIKKPSRSTSHQSYEIINNQIEAPLPQGFAYPLTAEKLTLSPHKFVDGIRVCQSANCKVCNPKKDVRMEYRLDLPGPCKFCNECNCSEGIEPVAYY